MATHSRTDDLDVRRARLLQVAAMAVAATFLLVGIAGFIPGITTNLDDIEWIGRHDHHEGGDQAELLGVFHVSILHNLVHALFGVGLLMARTVSGARLYLVGGGIAYALVWLYGALIDQDSDANFLPINFADNILHFGLAVGMISLGVLLAPRMRTGASDVS